MDRREFLQHSFFTAGALTALPQLFASVGHAGSERSSSAKKVVIIGAGLAGMSAAYELMRAGHDSL